MASLGNSALEKVYGWLCGRGLRANPLHFQYVPFRYARRDIKRDGPRLRGRVLDVGCGDQPYRSFLTGATCYVGLDYPPRANPVPFKAKPEVYGDAQHLPFADQSFDAVVCTQVLEHLARPDKVVGELARVLRPGGLALVSVPFFYNLHLEPHDYFRFSPYGIRYLLEDHGLAVLEIRGQGGIGTLLVQMLHNWLFSTMARGFRQHFLGKILVLLAVPLFLPLSLMNNLMALALDRVNGPVLRFASNLWVLAKKPATQGKRKGAPGHK
jgi:SAM-dependent methyltransferase